MGTLITSTLSSISKGYSNSIYRQASDIVAFDGTSNIIGFIMVLIFSGLFIYSLSTKRENYFVASFYRSLTRQFSGWWGIIYSGAAVVLFVFAVATQSTVIHIQKYAAKNLEIIRPYVGDNEYYFLRSQYLQIENKEDFEKFQEKIESISSEHSIKLRKLGNV
jgi:hypothetical protein